MKPTRVLSKIPAAALIPVMTIRKLVQRFSNTLLIARALNLCVRLHINENTEWVALAQLIQFICTSVLSRTIDPTGVSELLFDGVSHDGKDGSPGQLMLTRSTLFLILNKRWRSALTAMTAHLTAGLVFAAVPYVIVPAPR